MQLRAWLECQGKGATAALARAAGTRWATIHDIAKGHIPKADLAKRIEDATGGAVTAAELLGLTSATAESADAAVKSAEAAE